MGTNGKAVAAFGLLVLDAPRHAEDILSYLVQLMPHFPAWPPMVQEGVLFFLVSLPVSAAGSYIIWRVKNQPPVMLQRPQSIGQPDV